MSHLPRIQDQIIIIIVSNSHATFTIYRFTMQSS